MHSTLHIKGTGGPRRSGNREHDISMGEGGTLDQTVDNMCDVSAVACVLNIHGVNILKFPRMESVCCASGRGHQRPNAQGFFSPV